MIVLSPEGQDELATALAEAFTSDDLTYKLEEPLGIPLFERNSSRSVRQRAAAIVRWAVERNRAEDLLTIALDANPYNSAIRTLNEAAGLAEPSSLVVDALRGAIEPSEERRWMTGLAQVRRQVCRVRVENGADGMEATGFLVGPDLVMTIAMAFPDGAPISKVVVSFEGVTLGLAQDEPIVWRSATRLLILRLERPIGRELDRSGGDVVTRARGWISMFAAAMNPRDALIIVAHVRGKVTVSADRAGYIGSDGERIRYHTSSLQGSLGAPCFNTKWELAGIHVGSERDGANHGLSLAAIMDDLERAGLHWTSEGISRARSARNPLASQNFDDRIRGMARTFRPAPEIWSPEVTALDIPEELRWAWAEAAAVHATFDPRTLVPVRRGASSDARFALQLESQRAMGTERWVPPDRIRRPALERLAKRGSLASARALNPTDADDPVDVALGAALAGRVPPTSRTADATRAWLQVIDWLDGLVPSLPKRDELTASLERQALLAPFRHLASGFFAGREAELAALAAYEQDRSGMPLFIHAPGGMGKSALLAHFILEDPARDPMRPAGWKPFVYLDFDRPDLDATDPIGILVAIVAQMAAQVPASRRDAAQFVETWTLYQRNESRSARATRKQSSVARVTSPREVDKALDDIAPFFRATPNVPLILDTLEEVQFATPDAIAVLVELVRSVGARAPALRPILAGRIEVTQGVTPMTLGPLPAATASALLDNELPANCASRSEVIARLVEIVGGNPLSLRLAAQVFEDHPGLATKTLADLEGELQAHVNDALIQGRLYERILDHIHDGDVRKIAYPGLVLRKITPELIRDVLAEPCGLGQVGDTRAKALFDTLAAEVALVQWGTRPIELILRPELRRVVREDFARDSKTLGRRLEIHRAAVRFHGARDTIEDRAEEIYHRLALDEDPTTIDERWLQGVEPFLRDAVSELSPRAAAYLANRVGGVVDDAQIEHASDFEWEQWAESRASALIKFGQPAKALELLDRRVARLPISHLYYVESVARRMLPNPDLAGAERAAERAVDAARASSNAEYRREALDELVQVRRLRGDTPGVLRALADLGDLGDELGDDLVLLRSNLEGLEAISFHGDREDLTSNAVRVFSRLPDELIVKAPELARRVAAQVGAADPQTVKRVIGLVGFGSLDEDSARGLHDVLTTLTSGRPELASLVPHDGASPREIASAARFIVTNHDIDPQGVSDVADWLGTVVTPRAGS